MLCVYGFATLKWQKKSSNATSVKKTKEDVILCGLNENNNIERQLLNTNTMIR